MKFQGSIPALITPMNDDGSIDEKAFCDLIEWHIQSKSDALVIAGTTGESATLDPEEHFKLLSLAVKQAAGRLPIIAGAGTNATRSTLQLVDNAKRAGADACLIVTPYYNRPTQNGLYEHYKTIAEHSSLPIILYNVPGRTACDILPETVERLAKVKNIIGIKEASGKVERCVDIMQRCGKEFAVYSGDDHLAADVMLAGAQGVISVTANVAPLKMHEMSAAALKGDRALTEKLNAELMPLHHNLFIESNPIPTKWALHNMGKIKNGIRMPLLPLDTKFHQKMKDALHEAGVTQ